MSSSPHQGLRLAVPRPIAGLAAIAAALVVLDGVGQAAEPAGGLRRTFAQPALQAALPEPVTPAFRLDSTAPPAGIAEASGKQFRVKRTAQAPSPPAANPAVGVPPAPPAAAAPGAANAPPSWPTTVPEAKAEAAAKDLAASDKPDVYAPEDILIAKARCTALLEGLDVVVVHEEPIKQGNCGAPAPVQLISIGRKHPVALTPPATMTCDMVATLHAWVTQDVQPLAKKHLGTNIVGIETMSSYSCRNAYGRKKTNLSEHGRANALDIRGFTTAAAKEADVLADWGPTAREIQAQIAAAQAAAAKLAADKAAAEKAAAVARAMTPAATPATAVTTATQRPPSMMTTGSVGTIIEGVPGIASRLPGAAQNAEGRSGFGLFRPSQLGGPKSKTEPQVEAKAASGMPAAIPAIDAVSQGQRARFLRLAHTAACKRFGTVLGPESNLAHRNHFHIDMAERTTSSFCE